MKRKNLFALVLAAALLVCSCGWAENGMMQTTGSIPEVYLQVIEIYYNVFYADWYRALTKEDLTQMGISPDTLDLDSSQRDAFGYDVEDVNGDGIPELFFGLNHVTNIVPLFQVLSIVNGELFCLYNSGNGGMAYLRSDGTLLYEGSDDSGDIDCFIYTLNEQNFAVLTDGMIRRSGVCYVLQNGYQGPAISDEQFKQTAAGYEQSVRDISFTPIRDWQTGVSETETVAETTVPVTETTTVPVAETTVAVTETTVPVAETTVPVTETTTIPVAETTQPAVTGGNGAAGYYTHQTLYNDGIPVANLLVPQGWTAELTVNWNFCSTTTPGVATVILTSPDGHGIIRLASAEHFMDYDAPLTYPTEGAYRNVYMTYLRYRNAADFQKLTLEMLNCENAEFVEELEVPEALCQTVITASELLLQNTYNSGNASTPLSSEGTVAHRHYRVGDRHLEMLTLDMSARGITYGSVTQNENVCWYIPTDYLLAADSQADYDRYHPVFEQVVACSSFTLDFQYVNLVYGDKIREVVHSGLLQESYQYIMSDSIGWLTDYYKTTESDAGSWSGGWDDVIKEVNTYQTTDGGAIKVSTQYDTVYQNGDQIYMGPESQSPEGYGWTKLEIAK